MVIDALAPPARWLDAVVLDAKPIPFTLTTHHPDGTITTQQKTFQLLGVQGNLPYFDSPRYAAMACGK